mgnify:CR=1 FL=1
MDFLLLHDGTIAIDQEIYEVPCVSLIKRFPLVDLVPLQ